MSKGFVVGTGDLSELALGWSTYNGDHMSMYNPNCSIPKTLVKFWSAMSRFNQFPTDRAADVALDRRNDDHRSCCWRHRERSTTKNTEATGPYELHDFILYHALRCGYSPQKILFVSRFASFTQPYSHELIERTMRTFYTRFFRQQYKRSCIPDGPKVGTVNLSPRGDWRMPSDADPAEWLKWNGS